MGVDTREHEAPARLVYFIPKIVKIEQGGSAEKALKIYEAWKNKPGGPGPITEKKMIEIYKAAGEGSTAFKTLAHLIQENKISNQHSVEMAKHRERWIEEIVLKIGEDNGWQIGRSDSGNTSSGMKSDLDQTFYVFERSSDGKSFVRNEKRDNEFIELFKQRWEQKHPGISLEALDIASIEGRNRFPDPRDTTIEFSKKFRRTIEALRNTPGAYTYPGAVKQQMQLRALNEIIMQNPRAYQLYGPSGESPEWKKLPFNSEEAIRTMFGIEPELMPGHAYGAAMANHLEMQRYMKAKKFESKYHLRIWEDSLFVLWLAEKGLQKEHKLEYFDLDPDERKILNEEILGRLFPEDSGKRRLHEIALDISADLRLLHKNKPEKISSFSGQSDDVLKNSKVQEQLIFKELAQEMFGDDFDPDNPSRKHIEMAIQEHRKLASEFGLESVYKSSKEALKLLLDPGEIDPFNLDQYRHLTTYENDPKWPDIKKNIKEAAHLTFLYSLYDLGIVKSASLLKRLRQDFPGSDLKLLGLWFQGRLQGVEGVLRSPELYKHLYGEYLRGRLVQLDDGVQRHILSEIGFKNVEKAKRVRGFLETRHLEWSLGKFVGNRVYDPGNIDALAQIVRAYVESKGDMKRVEVVTLDEIVMAIPVFGQIVSASRADIPGLILMGAGMASPVGGGVLLVYSVGQAGYAIFELEYARPASGNIVSAVYRGFAGPEIAFYDDAPEFTLSDQEELTKLETKLNEEAKRILKTTYTPDRRLREWGDLDEQKRKEKAEYDRVAGQIQPKINLLLKKKKIWEDFRDPSAYGGFFTGAGAQLELKLFENYLLKEVEPIISFSPAGIVDFRADFDPVKDKKKLKELEEEIKNASGVEEMLRAAAEYQELNLQKAQYERAQRYLKRALKRADSTEGMTKIEAKLLSPELMFKLKRDSLYPWLTEKGFTNPDAFIDQWLKDNDEKEIVSQLVRKGLMRAKIPVGTSEFGASQQPIMPESLPSNTLEQLKEQVYHDFMKSANLYQEFQKREKLRKKKSEIEIQNRINAYQAEAAGIFAQQINKKPELRNQMAEILTAMRWVAVKRNPPKIDATVYHISDKERTSGHSENPKKEIHEFKVSVKIQADPKLYTPPYHTEVHFLNKSDAKRAVSTKRIKRMALGEDLVELLKRTLEKKATNLKDDEVLITLVSVFASGMPDLKNAIPETIEELPITRVSLNGKQFYLMGQSLGFERLIPKKEKPKTIGNFVLSHKSQPVQEYVQKVRAALPAASLEENIPGLTQFIVSNIKKKKPKKAHRSAVSIEPKVERVGINAEKAKKRYAAAKRLDRKPYMAYAARNYIGRVSKNYLIRANCNGQVNYMFVVNPHLRERRTFGTKFCLGLPNGKHNVAVSLITEDGETFSDSFSIQVEIKNGFKLTQLREKLGRARQKVAEFDPKGFRYMYAQGELGNLIGSNVRYTRALIDQGQGTAKDILPLIRERVRWAEKYLQIKTDPQRKITPERLRGSYFKNLKGAIKMLAKVGGPEALALAKELLPKAQSVSKTPSGMTGTYRDMVHLFIGAANDVASARGYLEKNLNLWRTGGIGGGTPQPLTEDQKNRKRQDWPRQMTLP
ncbi:MAG: hypothetical protein NPINA01_19980 [Nitrospinaceae bacterium]|nr:MAG: hypothetical protein NPINA01_19980 [Nitrospinaceae bacterium]